MTSRWKEGTVPLAILAARKGTVTADKPADKPAGIARAASATAVHPGIPTHQAPAVSAAEDETSQGAGHGYRADNFRYRIGTRVTRNETSKASREARHERRESR